MPGRSVWWEPRHAAWWIGVLFAIGSTCFLIGPFPGLVELVGSAVDGMVFFVGSIFFTSAAGLSYVVMIRIGRRADPLNWWAALVQFIGTLYFNVDTFRAMQVGIDQEGYDRLVWTPDTIGCICFLIAGWLAYLAVAGGVRIPRERGLDWTIAAVNFLGCVFFGLSALGAFFVPSTGSVVDLAAANVFTSLGALCFLIGAVLLLPADAAARNSR